MLSDNNLPKEIYQRERNSKKGFHNQHPFMINIELTQTPRGFDRLLSVDGRTLSPHS